MRLRLLLLSSVFLLSADKASTWQPCMPFCDVACTGASALALSVEATALYAKLGLGNVNSTVKTSVNGQAALNQQANLAAVETSLLSSRLNALNGLATKISLSLDVFSKEQEKRIDHIAEQYSVIRKGTHVSKQVISNSRVDRVGELVAVNDRVELIPELNTLFEETAIRSSTFAVKQVEMGAIATGKKSAIETAAVLLDTKFDSGNPFTSDEIDPVLWEEYEKQVFALFNFVPEDRNSHEGRVSMMNRHIALGVISKLLAENTIIPDDKSSLLKMVVSDNTLTAKEALYETFRQYQSSPQVQLDLASSNKRALLVMLNTQLAQRNVMLNEILKLRKAKGALLALHNI